MTTIEIKLTPAQRSALECREGGGLPKILREAWNGVNRLRFSSSEVEELWQALNECSNGEDGSAENESDPRLKRMASGAALALANLSFKVLKSA